MNSILRFAARLAMGAVLALAIVFPAAAEPIGKGNGHQTVDLGGISLEVFTYRPKNCAPAGLLLVFHGLHRNIDSYRDDLRPMANELCMVELVPLFDEQRFPSWRYQKGGIAHHGEMLPAADWTGNLVLRLVDWARKEEGQPNLPYIACGHSAGAQFLSRFAAFTPSEAKAILIANPSTHVLPSLDIDAPFGFKGAYAPEKAEVALRNYLAQPVVMILGQDDVGDKDRDDEPAALQQGATRYARGMNTFHAAQAAAAARGWPFRWQLVQLPGVGHSAGEVFNAKPVRQVLRAVMSVRAEEPTVRPIRFSPDGYAFVSAELVRQEPTTPSARPADPQQSAPQTGSGQGQPKPPSGEEPDKPEVKITPQQAQELFHSVDEILDFDSKQTGMPIHHNVKRRLTSRDEVVSYLTKHMDDEDTKRMLRSELVLKKFGLVPRDFDLEKLMIALLREEVAGYYDPKTKTVNLLDWVPMEEQEPVMAHELTHALQDQTINLQKWMKKGDRDLAEVKKDITPEDIENDEIGDTREAVIEGQAQAITFQYAIAPTGHTITDSPALVQSMEEETVTGTANTKVFNSAPIFMQESLTFPYSWGMDFVIAVMRKEGKEKAFADVLRNPPHTTRQIMEPETYISGEKLDPIPVPKFKEGFKDYQKFDVGAMGEFDVAVLVEQYAGKAESKRMYPAWRGGYYYAAKTKAATAGGPPSTASLGLLYVSRWADADKAAEFAAIYAHSLRQRYRSVDGEADPVSVSGPMPTANQTAPGDPDQPAQLAESKPPQSIAPDITPLRGRHVWTTEEGTVVIEEQGNTVLVSETLDPATTAALEKEVFVMPSAASAK